MFKSHFHRPLATGAFGRWLCDSSPSTESAESIRSGLHEAVLPVRTLRLLCFCRRLEFTASLAQVSHPRLGVNRASRTSGHRRPKNQPAEFYGRGVRPPRPCAVCGPEEFAPCSWLRSCAQVDCSLPLLPGQILLRPTRLAGSSQNLCGFQRAELGQVARTNVSKKETGRCGRGTRHLE